MQIPSRSPAILDGGFLSPSFLFAVPLPAGGRPDHSGFIWSYGFEAARPSNAGSANPPSLGRAGKAGQSAALPPCPNDRLQVCRTRYPGLGFIKFKNFPAHRAAVRARSFFRFRAVSCMYNSILPLEGGRKKHTGQKNFCPVCAGCQKPLTRGVSFRNGRGSSRGRQPLSSSYSPVG